MMVDQEPAVLLAAHPDGRLIFGGRNRLDPVDVPVAQDFLYDHMVRIHPSCAVWRSTTRGPGTSP